MERHKLRNAALCVASWVSAIAFTYWVLRFIRNGAVDGFGFRTDAQVALAGFVATVGWMNVVRGWWRPACKPNPGHCRACDYDLTGNTSGRCPECGKAVAPEPEGVT